MNFRGLKFENLQGIWLMGGPWEALRDMLLVKSYGKVDHVQVKPA